MKRGDMLFLLSGRNNSLNPLSCLVTVTREADGPHPTEKQIKNKNRIFSIRSGQHFMSPCHHPLPLSLQRLSSTLSRHRFKVGEQRKLQLAGSSSSSLSLFCPLRSYCKGHARLKPFNGVASIHGPHSMH